MFLLPTFIRLENSLEAALSYHASAQMEIFSYAGVQLLPNQQYPYKQQSSAPGGIEIESYEAMLCDASCHTELWNFDDYFSIVNNFNDENGIPQVIWSLNHVDYDAGYRPVYLKIKTGANSYIYSSRFYMTAYRSKLTSRWDYGNDASITNTLAIQLQIYKRQQKSEQAITNYTPVSSGYEFTATTKLMPFERWNTNTIDVLVLEELKKIFLCNYRYCDFQAASLKEAIETPDLEAEENFAETELQLIRNPYYSFNPNFIPVVPPVQPLADIALEEIIYTSDKLVRYIYTIENLSPSLLIFQWSTDQVNWEQYQSAVIDGDTNAVVHQAYTNNYYYRIYDPESGLYSNVIQIALPGITINNITSPQNAFVQTGNNYSIYYTLNNFTASQDLSFEASVNGITWEPLYYNTGNQNPKAVSTPTSSQQYTKFRIRYNGLEGILSNVFEFEF